MARVPGAAAVSARAGLIAGVAVLATLVFFGSQARRAPNREDAAADLGPSLAGADVVLITIDTLRADALGFAGNRRASTPTLDRLAAAGRVFTDAHAHNVVTLPSHANILTGLYPYQHGVRDNAGFALPASVPTLGTLLRRAGYATGAVVAAFPLDARFGLGRGFDLYDDNFPRGSNPDQFLLAERRGDEVVRAALRWWNGRRGSRRFLWAHLYDPHAPYEPPEPFASRFREHPYLGEVAAADSFLAPLLGPFLDGKDGRDPPALVIVTADHGESLGEHGELTHGLFAYEATLKVPLLIWWPGVQPGRDGRPARHVDIVPTVLQALRLARPAGLPGRSLLGPPAAAAVPAYFEALTANLQRGWAPLRGMLRERQKLIDLPLPELYDLADDPGESRNLFAAAVAGRPAPAAAPAARVLRAALAAESAWPAPSQPAAKPVSSEEEARLRSLGYSAGRTVAPPPGPPGPPGPPAGGVYTADDDPKRLIGLDQEIHQAIELYAHRRFAESAALAREVVAARPTMSEGYVQLAVALRQGERQEEAIAVLRQALAHGAANAAVRRQLGLALTEANRGSEAVAVLRPLSGDGDPADLDALGLALSAAGRPAEAVAVLEQAAAAAPSDPKALEDLGVVALRLEKPAQARDYLERALKLNDRLPIAWNTLGVALYQLKATAAALDAWTRAAALDPGQFEALYNLGLVAAAQGDRERARGALTRFVAAAPKARWGDEIGKAQAVLARLGR
ncbi:MAG TPA: sulfatase-like hydrolase/transferase [Thermoanaerobaculia bacterium]|nr:sulfatase-like hydrolase/transferase [Thermoanaerobaculia bacterium]